ncbi:hypothetical protein GALMADRAFT_1204861 [Galerina marginata CBS 339.88]|uniref:Uncharacterized protein n=1 Tax=Galerina marginata (strain CBS 339.88) TaxID=685588 RepID=A0A067S8D2_GALM3|nr:hypothetical protein GALMADRAFT_1204861 [Galerina marginata CBS 339.88]
MNVKLQCRCHMHCQCQTEHFIHIDVCQCFASINPEISLSPRKAALKKACWEAGCLAGRSGWTFGTEIIDAMNEMKWQCNAVQRIDLELEFEQAIDSGIEYAAAGLCIATPTVRSLIMNLH